MNSDMFLMVWLCLGASLVLITNVRLFTDIVKYRKDPQSLKPERREIYDKMFGLFSEGEDVGVSYGFAVLIFTIMWLTMSFFVLWCWPFVLIKNIIDKIKKSGESK